MTSNTVFDEYVKEYEAWYESHPEVYESEIKTIREQLQKLPENLRGIEVGLGTGRFSEPLDIKEGIEPSEAMAAIARKRGIEVMEGVAEQLPYGDLQFDFVLFVTICHLKSIPLAVSEAYRVLKPGGALIMGFLDKDRAIARAYEARRHRSKFYAKARFYSVEYLKKILTDTGFKHLEFNQTLFGELEQIKQVQEPEPGFGKGSFVTVKAEKK